MKVFYLLAAIVGAVVPYAFFIQFAAQAPTPGPGDLVAALFANGAVGCFTTDLLISSLVFWAYIWNRRARGPSPWLFIGLNLVIGLSCALPAYLYANTRRGA